MNLMMGNHSPSRKRNTKESAKRIVLESGLGSGNSE
jgi:hypothetical protein